jgi:hypothetical protein
MTITLQSGPVTEAGFYFIPEDDYHADPAPKPSVSSGLLSVMVNETAADAFAAHPKLNPPEEDDDNAKYDLGTVAHTMLLNEGKEIVVIDANDWKKKVSQEARDEAFAAGKQPCLVHIYEKAVEMAAAARNQLADDKTNFDAFTNGTPEVSGFAKLQTDNGKIWGRNRIDWLMDDKQRIYDYKTWAMNPDPEAFVKYLIREGRDIQAPHYTAVTAAIESHITGEDIDWDAFTFRFVVQHNQKPYTLSIIEYDSRMAEFSHDRWKWAIEKWARCGKAGKFPGYAPTTHYVTPPSWAEQAWLARIEQDGAAEAFMRGEYQDG